MSDLKTWGGSCVGLLSPEVLPKASAGSHISEQCLVVFVEALQDYSRVNKVLVIHCHPKS